MNNSDIVVQLKAIKHLLTVIVILLTAAVGILNIKVLSIMIAAALVMLTVSFAVRFLMKVSGDCEKQID